MNANPKQRHRPMNAPRNVVSNEFRVARHANHPIFRAAFAQFMHNRPTNQNEKGPEGLAGDLWPGDIATQRVIIKGDATPLSTSGQSALVGASVGDFFSDLPLSAGASLLKAGMNVPLASGQAISVPYRSGAAKASSWVAELDEIPVDGRTTASVVLGPTKKLATISVISGELSRRFSAESTVQRIMAEDAAATLDAGIFNDAAASDAGPAGLLYGVSALAAAPGGDEVAIKADLGALATALATAGASSVALGVSPAQAFRLALSLPDLKWPIWASTQVAAGTVIAVDPSAFAWGASDLVDIDVAKAATLHMSDTPAEIVSGTGPTTADPVRSVWQTDAAAIRMICWLAFAMRDAGRVQVIEGVSW